MARPERNNVDYFPFICEEGKKMYYIEETYGNDGFATFIKILRELAKTDYHYLDLSKPTTVMFLSAKCKISKEILLSIINDLADLGKFDLMLWNENKIIWCQDFIDGIQDAYFKRKNKCISLEGLLLLLQGLGIRKPSKCILKGVINTQSKVEYTKVEETKENNTQALPFKFFDSLVNYGFNKDLVSDWIKVRKTKKATNTKIAFDKFIIEVEKSELDKNVILETCIEKSWSGFKAEWINNLNININKKITNEKLSSITSEIRRNNPNI